jgi:chemotaxis signal transduction protein
MLLIKVSDHSYAIPTKQISHIGITDYITPIPFLQPPIKGLINFNNSPLILVSLAQALGHESHNVQIHLVVSTPFGDIALEVAEVLNFEKLPESSPEYIPPQIEVTKLLPWTKKPALPSPMKSGSVKTKQHAESISVLLVRSGNSTVALRTDCIERIQEASLQDTLEVQSSEMDMLIRIKDNFLSVKSLGNTLGLTENLNERIAVIIRNEQTWALLVEQVVGIERIHEVYSSGTADCNLWCVGAEGTVHELINTDQLAGNIKTPEPRLWYVNNHGQIQELINANQLIGQAAKPLPIKISSPEAIEATQKQNTPTSIDSFLINCGMASYLLKTTYINCLFDNLETSAMKPSRYFKTSVIQKINRIPLINAGMLFFGIPLKAQCTLKLDLPNIGLIFIEASQVTTQESALTVPVPLRLPHPISDIFASAVYDEVSKQWLLNFNSHLSFAQIPWTIKKAIVKAISGWFDP